MNRPQLLSFVLAGSLGAAFLVTVGAQTTKNRLEAPPKVNQVDEVARTLAPLAALSTQTGSIQLRSADQMTQQDRDRAAAWLSTIPEHARFAGMEFDSLRNNYHQVACPSLPNHLFLRFSSSAGAKERSVVAVSIPREAGKARVLALPLQEDARDSNATIAAFNRIRAEEHPETTPSLVEMSECFVALVGESFVSALLSAPLDAPHSEARAGLPSVLRAANSGDFVVRLEDAATTSQSREWSLTFDAQERLLRAVQEPAGLVKERYEQPNQTTIVIQPLHEAPVDLKGKPVQ